MQNDVYHHPHTINKKIYICYLPPGRSVLCKKCDRGLENAARGRRPRAAFSSPRHSFSLYGPTLSRQITYFFSCGKLAYKWVCLRNFVIDFPCHLKVNRDKHVLINRRWKCKKGKRLTITANFSNFAPGCDNIVNTIP